MSLLKKNITLHSSTFIITFAFTLVGYLFTSETVIVSVMWPVIGIALAYFSMYRYRVLPALFFGILSGTILSRYLFLSETNGTLVLLSLGLSVIPILQSLFFQLTMETTGSYGIIKTTNTIIYFFIVIFTAAFGSALSTVVISIQYGFDTYLEHFTQWLIGDLTGIIVFGTAALSSFYFDEQKIMHKKSLYGGLFSIIFIFLSFLIFSNYFGNIDYTKLYFVFIIVFFIAAFLFSYRMILFLSIVYIVLYRSIYIWPGDVVYFNVFLDLNLYLFTVTILSMVMRMVLYNIEEKNKSLEESNIKLENLISSTNQLIAIRELRMDESDSNVKYVKKIFRIALSLYDCFDVASCYIKVDNEPLFIDAEGYDIDLINSIDFSNQFQWALHHPEHIVSPENDLKERLGDSYSDYNSTISELKESIRFGIYIDEENCGGMSFDIKAGSARKFTKVDFENFQAFQKLMNSLYEINFLNNKNVSLKNDIVFSLIKTLELYDNYTGGHSQEVAILSKKIAVEMKLSEQEIYDIYWAGIVHDIGKIGIDYTVLNKKEKLSEGEYNTVKLHPIFGAEILEQSEDLRTIATIVKHHHEWWDGNGYPSRLKGHEIPLGSQILCVADCVSAMHGRRPYADTKTQKEIINELKTCSGTQFKKEIADVMIRLIEQGCLITLADELV